MRTGQLVSPRGWRVAECGAQGAHRRLTDREDEQLPDLQQLLLPARGDVGAAGEHSLIDTHRHKGLTPR